VKHLKTFWFPLDKQHSKCSECVEKNMKKQSKSLGTSERTCNIDDLKAWSKWKELRLKNKEYEEEITAFIASKVGHFCEDKKLVKMAQEEWLKAHTAKHEAEWSDFKSKCTSCGHELFLHEPSIKFNASHFSRNSHEKKWPKMAYSLLRKLLINCRQRYFYDKGIHFDDKEVDFLDKYSSPAFKQSAMMRRVRRSVELHSELNSGVTLQVSGDKVSRVLSRRSESPLAKKSNDINSKPVCVGENKDKSMETKQAPKGSKSSRKDRQRALSQQASEKFPSKHKSRKSQSNVEMTSV